MALSKFFVNNKPTKKEKKVTPKEDSHLKDIDSPSVYANLDEVIDKNRTFSMLYSGVEDDKNFNTLYDLGIRNFLMSYHYVQRKRLNVSMYEQKKVKFLIDSGAFTFINSTDYHDKTIEEWEKHIEIYLKWALKHKDVIFAIASLDIEQLVGGDKVQEWNEKYFEPFMLETGIPVCFVWHPDQSKLTWEQYCQRYPYVGLSWSTDQHEDGLKFGTKMLKIAEKYGAVVHGMAMTRTSLLPKLPFYTVDSTTWMVGVQYGEVNFWKGNKMSRLKKDKWKGEYLNSIVSLGSIDRQKLLDEDPTEMIKANVQAFIQAEEWIQDKAKSRMYWLKPTTISRSEEDIDSLEFPNIDWLETNSEENWEEYAKSFNISVEDKDTAIWLIIDITCFLNWDNEEYQEYIQEHYTPERLKEVHDLWVNRIVPDDETRIEDLKKLYIEVVTGKNDKLLNLGTNFDRVAKERDRYVEEDLDEIVDLEPKELSDRLGNALPSGDAPEIDSLDDEIFDNAGVIAVRDSQGKFIKGQKRVKKPKNIYSEKYPKLVCNTCYASQTCPEFKDGYVCAYNKMFKRFDCRDAGDIIEAMQSMTNMNMGRLQRAAIFETIDGGIADGTVSGLIDQNMRLLMNMKSLYDHGGEVLRHTKTVNADGSTQETTSVREPGILERMFMVDSNKPKDTEEDIMDSNIIDVEPKIE